MVAALAGLMKRHEAALDRRGRHADAVVDAVHDRFRWVPDTVTVRYTVEGRPYRAEVPVGAPSDFDAGTQVEVIYDAANPSHAKLAEGWSPAYSTLEMVAVFALGAGVLHSAWRSVTTMLAVHDLGRGVAPLPVQVEGFSGRRWWQRWDRPWAGVWPPGADPTAVRASLHLPVERSSGLRVEEPSTILGPPSPGRWVLVVQGDRVIWPRGPARRDPPRRSELRGRVEHTDNPWG